MIEQNKASDSGMDTRNLSDDRALQYPMALRLGTILNGRFLIQDILGQGGFGITYLVMDLIDNIPAAVKEYMPQNIASRSGGTGVTIYRGELEEQYRKGLGDFLREAKVLASFQDKPGIVRARRYFEENGTAYLVMEYVQGRSLRQHIAEKGGRLPWEEAVSIMRPVIRALEDVHRAGILHRDVAPDNIYITPQGDVKLLDFGAARAGVGEQNHSMTVLLKPGYTALEQYTRNGRQGPFSDVYSATATLYASITGRLPPDAVERIEHDGLQPVSDFGISVPPELEQILRRGLAVHAGGRYQNMGEFLRALNRLLPEEETGPEYQDVWVCSACGGLNTGKFCGQCGAGRSTAEPQPVPQPIPAPQPTPQPVPAPPAVDIPVNNAVKKTAHRKWPLIGGLVAAMLLVFVLASGEMPGSTGRETSRTVFTYQPGVEHVSQEYISWLRGRADEGILEARLELADRYFRGHGVVMDDYRSLELYRLCAEQGSAEAEYRIGWAYDNGFGVPENLDEAVSWYQKAADHGEARAQYRLGGFYLMGHGVTKSNYRAFLMFEKAAEQGSRAAMSSLAECYEFGWGVPVDNEKAFSLYKESAELGDSWGQMKMGVFYLLGKNVEEDPQKAVSYLQMSAAQDEGYAQYLLGTCYLEGVGVSPNREEALRLLHLAADNDVEEAQKALEELE